ncbi:cupin domain-containing protein [Nocardia sp. alder85J]|uniref:cupin domain-containing protein n=1 Tax=Nocardia sp. alder85J TaxID=2862949 RepID=UPI001CD51D98|nr:cupin domain-containing protein [Nocardia sp. alder85J]MCX4098714.1 cupin domain-containing protein [Nocardia sp. alder85J]
MTEQITAEPPVEYRGYGPIVNDTSGPATTIRQIGGTGTARWKQLAYGAHLQGEWNTVEHVTLLPGAGVGEHVHSRTEEIYYIVSGAATMRVNGRTHQVRAGDLITTPIGTRHAIDNHGEQDMVFFVTEVYPGDARELEPVFVRMADGMAPVDGFRGSPQPVRVSSVALAGLFTGPWQAFSEILLEPHGTLGDYALPETCEVVLVLDGSAAITVEGETYTGGPGLCVAVPAGTDRRITNTAAGEELRLIATEVAVG